MPSPSASHCFSRLSVGVCLALFLLPLVSGCGPDYKSRAVVKGKVTIGKKALTTGTVMFYGKNGVTASAPIDTQGHYEMKDAPLGDCQITVTVTALPMDPTVKARLSGKGSGPKMPEMKNPEESSPDLPSAPTVPKEVVRIPDKFAKPETSGLQYKVEKGEHTHDIEL